MTKKPIDITGIANELKGASLFFSSEEAANEARRDLELAQTASPVTTAVSPLLLQPKNQSHKLPREAIARPTSTHEPPKEAPFVRSNERALERTKVRHTFDIFKDQLASLRQIQVKREEVFGKRYLLGDLAQEALDRFITKERNSE